MSKLDDILTSLATYEEDTLDSTEGAVGNAKQRTKDLLREMIDENFSSDNDEAYAFWNKVNEL